jgi:hypothetical protein
LPEPSAEDQLLLATLPPSKGQIRLALGVVIGLLVALAFTIPLTNIQLPTMEEHWTAGYEDVVNAISHPEVMQLPDKMEGVRTFDWAHYRQE